MLPLTDSVTVAMNPRRIAVSMHATHLKPTIAVVCLAALLLLGGCANRQSPPSIPNTANPTTDSAVTPDIYTSASDNAIHTQVLRTGRYQLVPITVSSGERNLLRQIVTIDLPPSMEISVRDGMVHVLRDSGLHLCPSMQAGFLSLPLPAVHRELGPTTLRIALEALAGPARRLQVDYASRTVCFERRTRAATARAQDNLDP